MKVAHENKMRQVPANKLVDPDRCCAESSRQHELVTITSLSEDGGALAQIERLPAHCCALSADLIVGLDMHVGDRLIVKVRRPERVGRTTPQWTATAVIAKE